MDELEIDEEKGFLISLHPPGPCSCPAPNCSWTSNAAGSGATVSILKHLKSDHGYQNLKRMWRCRECSEVMDGYAIRSHKNNKDLNKRCRGSFINSSLEASDGPAPLNLAIPSQEVPSVSRDPTEACVANSASSAPVPQARNRRAAAVNTSHPRVPARNRPATASAPREQRCPAQTVPSAQQVKWMSEVEKIPIGEVENLAKLVDEIIQAALAKNPTPGPIHGLQQRNPQQQQQTQRRNNNNTAQAAASIQKQYRQNRPRAIRSILNGPSPHCQATEEQITTHLREMFRQTNHLWTTPPSAVPNLASPSTEAEKEGLVRPTSPTEVSNRLARMSDTAPGPDRVRYSELKAVDPGCIVLSCVFNWCLSSGKVPSSWKTSTTVLLFKSGERENLKNWRPLALGNTIAKLYAAILADRLQAWATSGRRISPEQKGFLQYEGCLEHNFLLQSAIDDARRSNKELCIAWLDLENAFGSVPHSHILNTLAALGLPEDLIRVIADLYDGSTTQARTANGLTEPISITSGVKQGCPLSPIIFNLAIEPLIRSIRVLRKETAYKLVGGTQLQLLAYADDLCFISKSKEGLQQLLDVAATVADWCGLKFKPPKCATLHINCQKSRRVLPTQFNIQGGLPVILQDGEHYKHLGVPTGFRARQTPEQTINQLNEDLQSIDSSLLAPWQKIDAVVTFLLPRLDFILRGGDVVKKLLYPTEKMLKKMTKSWMNIPQRGSPEMTFLAPSRGGAGILPLTDAVNIATVTQGFRMLTCKDKFVERVAWSALETVVGRKIGGKPTREQIVAYLNGSIEDRLARDGGDIQSIWSRVRKTTRELAKSTNICWAWCNALKELQLVIPQPSKQPDVIRVHPRSRKHLQGLLKKTVRSAYLRRVISKPDQGKVIDVTSRWSTSNHMLRKGKFTRFADWRFIHRARLDCVPLNATRRFGDGDERCRRCGYAKETLPHVLNHCHPHMVAVTRRHDAILHRLVRAVPESLGVKQVN